MERGELARPNFKRSAKVMLLATSSLLVVADLYMIFHYAPRERVMGEVQRIFYLHVPLAWSAFLAFVAAFGFSASYLIRRKVEDDLRASVSAEIGVLLTTLTLFSGSLWARNVWGTFWIWEPRLTTAFILWLSYLFYLLLRRHLDDRQRARRLSSVYAILAFINVPIAFFSIRWWRTVHPIVIQPGQWRMELPMKVTLVVSFVTFTLFSLVLWLQGLRLKRMEERLRILKALWSKEV
jgi:heme exporter protein C